MKGGRAGLPQGRLQDLLQLSDMPCAVPSGLKLEQAEGAIPQQRESQSGLCRGPVAGCGARLRARTLRAASDAPAPTPEAQEVNVASV